MSYQEIHQEQQDSRVTNTTPHQRHRKGLATGS